MEKKQKERKKTKIQTKALKHYKKSEILSNTILRSQIRFKSDLHNVYAEEVNKIALNSNGDKRLQTHDRITTYPYGTNAYKVCESEMMTLKKYT